MSPSEITDILRSIALRDKAVARGQFGIRLAAHGKATPKPYFKGGMFGKAHRRGHFGHNMPKVAIKS